MKVFVCFTPLHILIAEKIIIHENINNYLFFYLSVNSNKTNRFYFSKFSESAIYSRCVKIGVSSFFPLFRLIPLALFLRFKYRSNLTFYIGNIKKIHSRLFMLFSGFSKIITFDDGVGNIVDDGYFSKNEQAIQRLFFSILNSKLSYRKIIKNIAAHYTIYDHKNVFENTIKIPLYSHEKRDRKDINKELVILVTSPFSTFNMMSIKEQRILYQNLIKEYSVDRIIKHPLESDKIIYDNEKIIDSSLIAEEIVLSLLDSYNITLIGTYSTVLLNLYLVEGIKAINIPVHIQDQQKKLELIFQNIE